MTSQPTYNRIGKTYDTTRRADPQIVEIICRLLQPKMGGSYLDIACGSGNYTDALARTGLTIAGIDISEEMLLKAKKKNRDVRWFQGDAKALPFQNDSFDGGLCTLATHHIGDIETAFNEAFRVIHSGNMVLLTCTPEQSNR